MKGMNVNERYLALDGWCEFQHLPKNQRIYICTWNHNYSRYELASTMLCDQQLDYIQ